MKRVGALIGLLLLLLNLAECFGQLPRDESPPDPDFQRFRTALDKALIQKDLASLKLLFADTIYESNDGCGWPGCAQETFFEYYFVGDSSEDWQLLQRIVAYGFIPLTKELQENDLKGDAYFAPAYFKHFEEGLEVYVLGKDVNIRQQPNLHSKVIRRVTMQKFSCIVEPQPDGFSGMTWDVDGFDWVQIQLKGGRVGYVATKFTSLELYKRVVVTKESGQWRIKWYFHPPGC